MLPHKLQFHSVTNNQLFVVYTYGIKYLGFYQSSYNDFSLFWLRDQDGAIIDRVSKPSCFLKAAPLPKGNSLIENSFRLWASQKLLENEYSERNSACFICGQSDPEMKEIIAKYRVHSFKQVCASCGDRADRLLGYKTIEEETKLREFLNSGVLVAHKYSALHNAGYY